MVIIENSEIMNLETRKTSASDSMVKSSVQKINLVADLIRGRRASAALLELDYCKKQVAKQMKKVLNSVMANSQNNYGFDIDSLVISEIRVGKSITLKRSRTRAKGRINKILKPFSKITIVLKEVRK